MTTLEWPGEKKACLCVSVNFDAEALDLLATQEDRLYGRYGYGRYGATTGLAGLLRTFEECGITATFFVCGSDAERHPGAIESIQRGGHEIAGRGLDLRTDWESSEQELDAIGAGSSILESLTGRRPLGYRAARDGFTAHTLNHLITLGYAYDSSFQDDDFPYVFAPDGDKQGGDRTLVEVPQSHVLQDALAFSARHSDERVFKTWLEEAEAMYEYGTLIPLTLHLRGDVGVSRPARLRRLREFLNRVTGFGSVDIMNGEQLCAMVQHAGLAPEPDPLASHRGTLNASLYRGDLAVSNSAFRMV